MTIIFSEVDVSQISGYVKYLVDNKVDGVYIIGTTGEGYNLTNDERLAIAKAWRQAIDKQGSKLLAVINVTSNCVKEAVVLSKQVDSLGFDAIAVLPPNYYKPNTINEWVSYLKVFGEAAPNTPLLYYHIPHMVGELNCNTISKNSFEVFFNDFCLFLNKSRYNRSGWRRTQTNPSIGGYESEEIPFLRLF